MADENVVLDALIFVIEDLKKQKAIIFGMASMSELLLEMTLKNPANESRYQKHLEEMVKRIAPTVAVDVQEYDEIIRRLKGYRDRNVN